MEGSEYCAIRFVLSVFMIEILNCMFKHLCICGSLHVICTQECRFPRTPAEGAGSSGTGVMSDCEHPDVGAGN